MKKRILIPALLLVSVTTAHAAGVNGDYEGHPIVKVLSKGKELPPQDVPAINYNDRTLVPLSLLRNLGAEVQWNASTYSVDVRLPEVKSAAAEPKDNEAKVQEWEILRDTYERLNDVNQSLWMFTITLQHYMTMDNPRDYSYFLEEDYKKILDQQLEAQQFALEMKDRVKMNNSIQDAHLAQSKLLTQIAQMKDLYVAWTTASDKTQLEKSLKSSLLLSLRSAQQTINQTNEYIHALIETQYK